MAAKRKSLPSKKRRGRRLAWKATKGTLKGAWWLTRKTGRGIYRGGRYFADEERLIRAWRRVRARTIARMDRPVWGRAMARAHASGPQEWRCLACGKGGAWSLAKGHVCAPAPQFIPRKPVGAPTPRPRQASPTTKGSVIVAPNTAAQRFAYLSQALPETVGEWEQLAHDLFSGVLMLANEIAGIAEDADIDVRVKDALLRLSDDVADLAEPARDVRNTFRNTYALHLEAASSGVTMPANPHFFEDAG